MSKGNTFENELLLLIFNNTDIADIGDAGGLQNSATAGSLYVALHTADPGEAGTQSTSEAAYTGYARVAVARSGAGWTVSGNAVENAALVQFGVRSDVGSEVLTHWSVGVASSGATKILYKGPIVPSGGGAAFAFTAESSTDVITIKGSHGLIVDDRVVFYATPDQALAAGLTEGQVYWVKSVSGDDITVSDTQGGATEDVTADGCGIAQEATTITVTQNTRPEIAAGALDITEN